MPAFDNANSVQGTAAANLTTTAWTIAGDNRLLIAGMVWSGGAPPAYSAMKWGGSGGTLLTQLGSTLAVGANLRVAMAYLIAPAAGSSTLYGEVAASTDEFCVGGVSVTGANQSTPLGTEVTNNGTTASSPATATVDVTSTLATDLIIDICGATQDGAAALTFTVGAGQDMRWEQESIGSFSAGTQSTESGNGGPVTMSETITFTAPNVTWGIIAVRILEAPAVLFATVLMPQICL